MYRYLNVVLIITRCNVAHLALCTAMINVFFKYTEKYKTPRPAHLICPGSPYIIGRITWVWLLRI